MHSQPTLDKLPSPSPTMEEQSERANVEYSEDVAAKFLSSLDPSVTQNAEITPEEARRVLWKIDLIVLPLISGTVILSAVDKVIISNAAILGMKKDLQLVGNEYSWAGSIFYFGFLFFEWPTAILIQRLPVAKLLAGLIFCWAALLLCTAATQDFAGLAAVRFIMGCAEAGAFPIASILTVMWYSKVEQPIRVAFWYNQVCYPRGTLSYMMRFCVLCLTGSVDQFSSVFSGAVSYGISQTHTSLAQWRLLFLVLGAFSTLYAVVILAFLPDSPVSAWWLTDRERLVCVRRVQVNNSGMEDKRIKWYQARECLADPKTWLLCAFCFLQNIPNGGLVTFSSIIVSGLGYSVPRTTLLGMPTGIVATSWQLILAIPCAKLTNKRCIIIALANLAPMACAILMWKLPRDNKLGLLAAYYSFYTYWGPYVMSTSVPMANISGHTKKVTMNAMYFLSYCIGNIVGPQMFRASDAPDYAKGYTALLICFVLSTSAILAYGFLCYCENAQRDRLGEAHELEDENEVFSDKTDKEKPHFRYMY